jgi:glucose/arabinose dehydrogenase
MKFLKGVLACAASGALILVGSNASAQLRSELVAGGLTLPVAIVQDPVDPANLFVVEQRAGNVGRVRIIRNGALLATPFLSISPVSTGSEQGLLGIAFPLDHAANGHVYVNYTDAGGTTNIVRFTRNTLNPLVADAGSALTILKVPQPFANHNGGNLFFGVENLLYIGLGDGGSGNDPGNRAQNGLVLLGKMLRIDPKTDSFPADPDRHYAIPPDNPFIGQPANFLPEIYSIGLRNPWKYTQDPAHMLGHNSWLIADVGQNAREEINYEFQAQSGRNYGWRVWEGTLNTGLGGLNPNLTTVTPPIFEYTHATGFSITGGYVYRGIELGPEFFGSYFYGDHVTNRIWTLQLIVNSAAQTVTPGANVERTAALSPSNGLSSFGMDSGGELYFTKYGAGQIWRIRPSNRVWMTGLTPFDSRILSGGLRHLVAQDGHSVVFTPPFDADRNAYLNFKGGLEVALQTDQTTTPNLNATIQISTNQSVGGTCRLFLRNWSTGNFVEVGSGAFGTSPTIVTINGISAGPYRNGAGRIDARVRADVSVSGFASRTTVSVDQFHMTSN